ncbi:hypothetical protein ACTID9_01185 [Brevibacillus fluminis]|uniref:hypothetical protein n=1 Tax=Brevibacillus fluminis TaxID=511487 RepID=UPI003F8AEBE5
MNNPFEHIVSTKQAATIFGKSERQIRNDCTNGKLTAQQLDPSDLKSPWMIYLPPDQYPKKGTEIY